MDKAKRNIVVGDIVIIKEEESPRNRWPLAIVDEVYPSQDGLVRKVKLRLADQSLDKKGKRIKEQKVLERPVHKCVVLIERDKPGNSAAEEP